MKKELTGEIKTWWFTSHREFGTIAEVWIKSREPPAIGTAVTLSWDEPDPPKIHQCPEMLVRNRRYERYPGGVLWYLQTLADGTADEWDNQHVIEADKAHCECCGKPLDEPERRCENCRFESLVYDCEPCKSCIKLPSYDDYWQPKLTPPASARELA